MQARIIAWYFPLAAHASGGAAASNNPAPAARKSQRRSIAGGTGAAHKQPGPREIPAGGDMATSPEICVAAVVEWAPCERNEFIICLPRFARDEASCIGRRAPPSRR